MLGRGVCALFTTVSQFKLEQARRPSLSTHKQSHHFTYHPEEEEVPPALLWPCQSRAGIQVATWHTLSPRGLAALGLCWLLHPKARPLRLLFWGWAGCLCSGFSSALTGQRWPLSSGWPQVRPGADSSGLPGPSSRACQSSLWPGKGWTVTGGEPCPFRRGGGGEYTSKRVFPNKISEL